ncbi:MAG: hypothetical protein P8I03_02430 [Thalassotalea sp.]|nr:hypothetical protein [Thalassotalea sp.]
MLDKRQQQLTVLIDGKLKKLRWYFIINTLVRFLPFLTIVTYLLHAVFSLMLHVENQSYLFSFLIACLAFLFKFFRIKRSESFIHINKDNYLAHCNRHFSSLEESAQLVLMAPKNLNFLQRFQQNKVCHELLHLLNEKKVEKHSSNQHTLNGQFHSQLSLLFTCLFLAGLWFYSPITAFEKTTCQGEHFQKNINASPLISTVAKNKDINLLSSQITVQPPKYTNLLSTTQKDLSIELLAGSEITWQLGFSETQQRYFIEFANGEINPLVLSENNQYTFNYRVEHTGLYKLYSEDKSFQQIHTLRVSLDKKPVIRILTPKSTITEIEKKGKTGVLTQVDISDDYQISHVEILASIAKGSGESVKFRDQVFTFDKVTEQVLTKGEQYQAVYEKMWDFTALNMEPGDELYFTVKAWDNKQPSAQLTSSETKIIRWLEDEEKMVMADGILIDFMPEYFKSQRQIIIETKELISDKMQLTEAVFSETSELLGVAQSGLKQKYGQYLGDEFDDGGAGLVPNMSNESEEAHHDDDEHEQEENHKLAQSVAASGHDHGVAGQTELEHSTDDKSGYSQLIETYAHNHEDTDIGMMSRQDPKALMKQSIANMWQAELYLMLSKPEQALPFEEKALKLLKMAKKAERIYVKRLGFEPPPVSEQRRYQGDLSEILSENKQKKIDLTLTQKNYIAQLYQLIKQQSLRFNSEEKTNANKTNLVAGSFLPAERLIIDTVKQFLQNQLSERPALINDVATLERIILADSIAIKNCENCIEKLKNKLWQLLEQPTALPNVRQSHYLMNDSLMNQYNELLWENNDVDIKSSTKDKTK